MQFHDKLIQNNKYILVDKIMFYIAQKVYHFCIVSKLEDNNIIKNLKNLHNL